MYRTLTYTGTERSIGPITPTQSKVQIFVDVGNAVWFVRARARARDRDWILLPRGLAWSAPVRRNLPPIYGALWKIHGRRDACCFAAYRKQSAYDVSIAKVSMETPRNFHPILSTLARPACIHLCVPSIPRPQVSPSSGVIDHLFGAAG